MNTATHALLEVEQAAARAEKARVDLHVAIHKAHSSGESLRKIAEAAGMSHEKVRAIVSR